LLWWMFSHLNSQLLDCIFEHFFDLIRFTITQQRDGI